MVLKWTVQFSIRSAIIVSILLLLIPATLAAVTIDINPTKVAPDQQVTVSMQGIPNNSEINLTLAGIVKTTPKKQFDYTISNFLFPYESDNSVFIADMKNLVPATSATINIVRDDGTEAARTESVTADGTFNATITKSVTKGYYNISFVGYGDGEEVSANVDFGGKSKLAAPSGNVSAADATTDIMFTPGGVNNGVVQVKVYVDNELQKEQNITVSNTK